MRRRTDLAPIWLERAFGFLLVALFVAVTVAAVTHTIWVPK